MTISTEKKGRPATGLRAAAACLFLLTLLLGLQPAAPAHAEGTNDLLTNGGKRALTEFRDTKTAGLYRRSWLRVYAKAGEIINMGSSGMGVVSGSTTGDIWLWNPNIITDSQMATASIPTPTMKCSTSGQGPNAGKLTTRAQEQVGPQPNTGGYIPCTYTAPEAGVYWIAMLGPTGILGNTDGTSNTITAPNLTSTQNAGVSMWDITVRDSGGATKSGRVFVDYLAMLAGGNGTTFQQFSTLYAIAADGFKYRIGLNGLDPNGYILYGNSVGFLDPDGKTPLYHDLVATENTLATPLGGVKQSPATAKLFFGAPNADLPTTIAPAPQIPTMDSVTFNGSAGGSTATYTVGGQFTYTGNVGGIAEIVISRNGTDFDPTTSTNRVLRAVTAFGSSVITWDGKDNSGVAFPVGGPYAYRASMHAGEYHFPLLDAENSALGGPTLTLLNPIGGTCPYALGCSTAFYDDRAYTTSTNVTVTPAGDPTNAKVPPTTLYANPATGFDSSTAQRKWGDGSGSGFGNWRGLDLWTYFPNQAVQKTLNVVAGQSQDVRIQKSHTAAFVIGSPASYMVRVANAGTDAIPNTVTVADTLPAGLTYVSAAGTGWSCGASGQTVTCTHPNTNGLVAGAYLPDITLTVSVASSAAPSVTNTATVSITTADPNQANNTSSDPTVIESADLVVTKSVSPTTATEAGQQVTFSVLVTNNGPSTATGVQVTDLLPAGLTYGSYTASQGAYVSNTGVWSVGSMPSGSSASLSIVARVNAVSCGGQIVNTASRTASSPFDYGSSNDSASATLTLNGIVSLSGVVTEAGTGVPLIDATITLTDSANHSYSTTTGAGGAYSFTSTQANPLALGNATVAVSKDHYATNTQTKNIATCGANTLDVPLGTTNLLVTKDDGKATAATNDVLTYAIKVQNLGTIAASGVVLVDTYLTTLLKFNSDTSSGISGLTVIESPAGTLTYTYGPALAAGAALEFTIQMQVLSPLPPGTTSVWNKMTASTTSPEADVTNNEKQDTDATASAPDLKISKTDGATTVQAGQTGVVYTLTYGNIGNKDSSSVTVVDTLDANQTFVSCPSTPINCAYNATARTVTWVLGKLLPGDSGTLNFTVMMNSGAAPGTVIRNKAAIDGGGGTDADLSNNTAFDSDLVVAPNIVLAKTVTGTDTPPVWGGQVTYRLTYTNMSAAAATNVVITDPLPAGATFVSASGACAHSSEIVTCTIGTVAAGGQGDVEITVTVAETTTGATQTAARLTAESAPGSSVTTSATTNAGLKLLWTDTTPSAAEGWNANPRAVTFDDASWTGPIVQGFQEAHWTLGSRINAQWVATTIAGQDHGNTTFYRQKFCAPLNATGLSGTLEVANDDYGDQYVNQVGFGTKIGAGEITSSAIGAGLQPGGNLYAVRLLNNTHGGHSSYENKDHPGLVFRLTAAWSGLAPFAAGPASSLAGASITITADPALLGGVAPFAYSIDYGDGTAPTEFGAAASFTHTYAAAGSYTAVVTARDAYGCTATDSAPITVLPAGRNLLANTASVGYTNAYDVNYAGSAAAGIQLLSRVDLGITKTSSPNPAYAGEPIVYTLHVTNNGAHSIGQVSLTDAMPAGVTGASYSASKGAYDPVTRTWTGELVAAAAGSPADSFDLTISGTVDPSATGALDNTANVAPIGGTDANADNNTASNSNTLARRADLGVTITADRAEYTPGGPLTYTVVVTNNGSAALTSYNLNLTLPAGFTVSSYTAEAGNYDPETHAWTGIQFGSVETLTLTIVGTVVTGITGDLVATATVSTPADVTDGVSSNNTATVLTGHPMAVTLADFSAAQVSDAIVITWETNSELNNRGFNLWRGTSEAGPDVKLNEYLIPAQSQGLPGSGFVYTWEDRRDLTPGVTYWYWLEDLDTSGALTRHAPVSVGYATPNAVDLAGFSGAAALEQAQRAGLVGLAGLALVALGGIALRRRRTDRTINANADLTPSSQR